MNGRLILVTAAALLMAGFALAAPMKMDTPAPTAPMPAPKLPPPMPMDHSAMDHGAAPAAMDGIVGMPEGIKGPTLKFPDGNMYFYVENDGAHVVALNGEGEVKWRREPFAEYPAPGEKVSPITGLSTPGYDPDTGRRVLMVRSATGFRGLEMISGDYLLG